MLEELALRIVLFLAGIQARMLNESEVLHLSAEVISYSCLHSTLLDVITLNEMTSKFCCILFFNAIDNKKSDDMSMLELFNSFTNQTYEDMLTQHAVNGKTDSQSGPTADIPFNSHHTEG